MEPRNVIVTGASRGIGEYIARAFAARPTNLLLVARSAPELTRLARELRSHDTEVAVAAIVLNTRSSFFSSFHTFPITRLPLPPGSTIGGDLLHLTFYSGWPRSLA